ncbi:MULTISPECIES: hypothetical protein [unclassified Roseofilum]|uniref:hypothetical protein n=1 Tax=unclassified Roseofilum TaxID=2620099 RepID=UPI001AFDA925|nr:MULTISPECIES: hypothetical protein [unclassified Roseofilum]MBP0011443.1 hypothetical protein [Roseofilum sp. Belize Diploria]MBP0035997.1 hypothetical protein [Roseofilum sp. Belize BBD 4]
MAQVLVPVHSDEQFEDGFQRYIYLDESEVPRKQKFNVGDKVRFCDDFVLVSHKTGERFTADVEHTHIIDIVTYDIDDKKYSYWVKIDPVVRHCGAAFSFWLNDIAPSEDNWYDIFDEDELAPINSSSDVDIIQSGLVQV